MLMPITSTVATGGPLGISSVEVIVVRSGMTFGTSVLNAVTRLHPGGVTLGVTVTVCVAVAVMVGVAVRVTVGVSVLVGVAVSVGHGPLLKRKPQPFSVPVSPAPASVISSVQVPAEFSPAS